MVLIILPTITSNNGSSSDVYRETFWDTLPLMNPPITWRTITNRKFLGEAMGRNKIKGTTRPMGTQDRGEARHGSTRRRRVGGTPTRAYGGNSPNNKCDMGTPYIRVVFEGERTAHPPGGARILSDVAYKKSKPYLKIKLIMKTRWLTTRFYLLYKDFFYMNTIYESWNVKYW